jgi:hypothetical protein
MEDLTREQLEELVLEQNKLLDRCIKVMGGQDILLEKLKFQLSINKDRLKLAHETIRDLQQIDALDKELIQQKINNLLKPSNN